MVKQKNSSIKRFSNKNDLSIIFHEFGMIAEMLIVVQFCWCYDYDNLKHLDFGMSRTFYSSIKALQNLSHLARPIAKMLFEDNLWPGLIVRKYIINSLKKG